MMDDRRLSVIQTDPPFMELEFAGDSFRVDFHEAENEFLQQFDQLMNRQEELDLVVLVHGFQASIDMEGLKKMKGALLEQGKAVLMVDWSCASGNQWYHHSTWAFKINPFSYFHVVNKISKIGQWIGRNLADLRKVYGNRVYIHGIGHSLGAHIVGIAAKFGNSRLNQSNTVPEGEKALNRITGLDPAAPMIVRKRGILETLFGNFVKEQIPPLQKEDAHFVDIIHTSGFLGTQKPIGHVDFYPNYGRVQPGCFRISDGSHMRVLDLYTASIQNPGKFMTHWTFDTSELRKYVTPEIFETEEEAEMGHHCLESTRGIFYLRTTHREPFFVQASHLLENQI